MPRPAAIALVGQRRWPSHAGIADRCDAGLCAHGVTHRELTDFVTTSESGRSSRPPSELSESRR